MAVEQSSMQLIVMPTLVALSTVILMRLLPKFKLCYVVYHVTADGWKYIGNDNVGPLYYKYQEEANK